MIETKLQASQGLPGEKRHPPKSISLNIFVSSANINTRLLELMTSGRSLTYKRKRAGPQIEKETFRRIFSYNSGCKRKL